MALSHTVRQTPNNATPAIARKQAKAGMLATARIPAATGTALNKGSRRRHNLNSKYASNIRICVKKVAGNEARNMAVNVAVTKKFGGCERFPNGHCFC